MSAPQSLSASRAEAWALELVGWPSVTGTAGEAAFAARLCRRLAAAPAFAGGPPARVLAIPVPGGPEGRAAVAALVPGRGRRTVVLTGHFDTVRIDDYGDLAPLATQPHELRAAMLARGAADAAGRRALADLEGGAFLPGRGLLDMKAGLAAALAAMEAFAADPGRDGNLLFLAVPDEEANSAGARAAAAALPRIAARWDLAFEAAINLDSLVDEGDDGNLGRRVALGTVGKLLPSALVVGRATHAADALLGLNAAALAGRLAAAVEWAEELADRTGDEAAAPPTLLGLKDGRSGYDATTPDRAWLYWNVMTHRRGPAEVLDTLAALCREAAAAHLAALAARRARVMAGGSGGSAATAEAEIAVVTFADLRREVVARDPDAPARLAEVASAAAGRGLDLPEQCRLITEHLWAASGRPGPAVVLGFASVPYLPTSLRGVGGERLESAVRRAAALVAERHGTSVGICRHFPGISDMSFLGQADLDGLSALAENTPAWRHGIGWPDGEGAIAGLPTVNAGPWGRDYHTPLERMHAGYAFGVLPELVLEIARGVLADGDRDQPGRR